MSLPIIQTIQNNIDNLKLTKANIKNAVNTDYNFINNEQIESYPSLIEQGIAYYKNRIPHAIKEGTDLSFNAAPLKFDNMSIKGNTYQKQLSGKNLLNLQNGTYSSNGITAVVENGKIIINGTATTTSFLAIPFVYEYDGSTYSISANNENTIGNTTGSGNFASVRISGETTTQAILGNKNATKTFNFKRNKK